MSSHIRRVISGGKKVVGSSNLNSNVASSFSSARKQSGYGEQHRSSDDNKKVGALPYPYSRSEECSWLTEEVGRHMAALVVDSFGNTSTSASQFLSHGWSSHQAQLLRQRYGSNQHPGKDKDSDSDDYSENERKFNVRCFTSSIVRLCPFALPVLQTVVSQTKEPLNLMLLGSAFISICLGNSADALSISIALLIVSLVAAVQEYRSEKALEQLTNLVPPTCTVLRDGHVMDHFRACNLVVGDLVLLTTGDRIPADCRVIDSVELTVDESCLTGENEPVCKTGEGLFLPPSPSLSNQINIVFAGTLVSAGRGRAVVVAVGNDTEFGKIATELNNVTSRKSPLQIKIDELSQRLAYLSTCAIVVIAVLGWLMGRPVLETLTVAVSLAVAAIPEGLPICVTVTLALGVLRMARANAIVKKLPVVESLGCTTAIASDKTGTLTTNESKYAYFLTWKQETSTIYLITLFLSDR